MPLDFPSSPTVGQQYLNWTWNGVAWVVTAAQPVPFYNNSGRNLADNALFNIQQRGPGPFTAAVAYNLDRWVASSSGDTISIQAVQLNDAQRTQIGDEAAVWGMQNNFTGTPGAGYNQQIHRVESVRRLTGKTVTVSFWAASAGAAGLQLGVSGLQYFGSGGSPSPTIAFPGQLVSISQTFARYQLTFNLPSMIGKTLGTNGDDYTQFNIWYSSGVNNSVNAGGLGVQSGIATIWGFQIEVGSQATPLEKLVPEVDLARCQRFYQLAVGYAGGYAGAPTTIIISSLLPVVMRTTPTLVNTVTSDTNLSSPEEGAGNNFIFFQGVTATANAGWILNRTCTASADL